MEALGKCGSIPKIVHQIWLGKAKPPLEWMESWKDFCRKYNWEYRLWRDFDIDRFGLTNKQAYLEATSYQKKSDIARYEILHRYGGLYCDCDMIWLGKDLSKYIPFEKNMFIGVQEYPGWLHIGSPYLCNGFFACPPKHHILKRCIEKITKNDYTFIERFKGAWSETGPVLLNNSVKEGVIILPYYYVFPKDFHYQQAVKNHCEFKDDALVFTYNGMDYPHKKNERNYNMYIIAVISVIILFLLIRFGVL